MRLGNLTAQHKTDAGTATLGGEERHKQVGGVGQAWTFVPHDDSDGGRQTFHTHKNPPACFERGVDRVPDEIDESLFELIGVALDGKGRRFFVERA
jgi:hypothetical protein